MIGSPVERIHIISCEPAVTISEGIDVAGDKVQGRLEDGGRLLLQLRIDELRRRGLVG